MPVAGRLRDFEARIVVYDKNKVQSIIRDITDRKQTEDALKESEDRYRNLVEKSGVAILIDDEKGRFTYFNQIFQRLFGYTKKEMQDQSIHTLVHPDDVERVMEHHRNRIKGKTPPSRYEFRGIRKNGDVIHLEVDSIPIKTDGRIRGTRSYLWDITKRKQAEQQIRMLGASVENATEGVVITNLEGKIIYVNRAVNRLYGYTAKQLHKAPAFRLNASQDDTNRIIPIVQKEGQWTGEIDQRRKDGAVFPANLTLFTVPDQRGKPQYVVSFITDITRQRADSEKIKASLHEKEILLKEIHHRVKNNLQIIISLLNLQAGKIQEKAALRLIDESKRRIYSMALVHEKLYQSDDFANIDFSDYIRTMAEDIIRTLRTANRIILDTDIKAVPLSIDKAIPCGLIVNELITNAVKHAFPNRPGKITITFQEDTEGRCELIVGDDGIGFSDKFDIGKSKSLGLQLVTILSEQIDGKIDIQRRKGTFFKIIFPR